MLSNPPAGRRNQSKANGTRTPNSGIVAGIVNQIALESTRPDHERCLDFAPEGAIEKAGGRPATSAAGPHSRRLADPAVRATAQHHARQGAGVAGIVDDDDPVDDRAGARTARIAVRL